MHKKYKTRIGAAMEEFLDLQRERSFCAADACHYMEQREIAVNITTVYRHLEQLVKDGILVKFKTNMQRFGFLKHIQILPIWKRTVRSFWRREFRELFLLTQIQIGRQ